MEVKAANIIIERDPMTKIPKTVLAWELEIYEAKYPGKIELLGHTAVQVDELPDAEAEAGRLRELHGADPKTNVVFFDDVYGRGRAGVAEFEKAILAARVRPAKAAKPEKKAAETDSADDSQTDAAGHAGGEGAGAPDPLGGSA